MPPAASVHARPTPSVHPCHDDATHALLVGAEWLGSPLRPGEAAPAICQLIASLESLTLSSTFRAVGHRSPTELARPRVYLGQVVSAAWCRALVSGSIRHVSAHLTRRSPPGCPHTDG